MDPCDPHAASSLVSQDEMRPVQAGDKLCCDIAPASKIFLSF